MKVLRVLLLLLVLQQNRVLVVGLCSEAVRRVLDLVGESGNLDPFKLMIELFVEVLLMRFVHRLLQLDQLLFEVVL